MNGFDGSDAVVVAYYLIGIYLAIRIPNARAVFYLMLTLAFAGSCLIFKLGFTVEMLGFLHMAPFAFVSSWICRQRHRQR